MFIVCLSRKIYSQLPPPSSPAICPNSYRNINLNSIYYGLITKTHRYLGKKRECIKYEKKKKGFNIKTRIR